MSTTTQEASSFSSFTDARTYDVFISFRGEDTRYNFTDHLHRYLVQKGIRTFKDDDLQRGEEISQALLQAIEGSRISVILFSEKYAFSKWCLDELVEIVQCKKPKQQLVLPIFYKVDPSDVRNQTGSFGDALAFHEGNFMDDTEKVLRCDTEKVLRRRAALTETANISGYHFVDGYISCGF